MKRLLCIISGMNSGGAETFLLKVYRKIDKRQSQFDFCVNIFEKGFYDDEINLLGGRIYHIPSKSSNYLKYKKELSNIIKSNNYKYVLRITSNSMGFLDLKIAKRAGATVCVARSSNSNDAEGALAKIMHFIGRIFYGKYVDVKIAPSDLAAIYTFGQKSWDKGEVVLLKNAVDTDVYFYDVFKRNAIRHQLSINDDTVLIGHIGRFSKQKNHLYLIDVFKKVLEKEPNSKLILIGTGELVSKIKQYVINSGISDLVLFMGVRNDIPALLSAMDILVMPSLYEGMPNTVIEAQATSLPCVILDSITRLADITGLVKYVSLSDSKLMWAETILEMINTTRKSRKTDLQVAGYDINQMVTRFTETIFDRG